MYRFTVLALLLTLLCHTTQGTYVVSWGANQYGQLGLGNVATTIKPTQISNYANLDVVTIRAGLSNHFAMIRDGTVYCAGNNLYGQLGVGSINNQLTPVQNSHAFGLDVYPIGPQTIAFNASTKDLYGWGIDAGYVVGSTFTGNQLTPRKSTYADFSGAVVGVSTGCGDGGAYSAGKNLNYSGYNPDSVAKLGTAAQYDQGYFTRMSFWNNVPLQKLFPTSSSHVCGLAKSNSLYCWGKNNLGQLGHGTTNDRSIPVLVSFFDKEDVYVANVVTGDAHTVLLTCGGKVYTWGSNAKGNLGLGTQDNVAHSTPILLGNLTSLKIVEIVSAMHTVYARNATNHWHVWGSNANNMTLLPQTADILSPTVSPYFRTTGLTHIATNSKSNFALAWVDGTPSSQLEDCPELLDECQLGMALCATNTKCVDTERSYKCVCGKGFQGDGRAIEAGGSGCVDVDECELGLCVAGASCENQKGSFVCTCPEGYCGDGLINGTKCTDIDECAEGHCPPNTQCQNTIGGYTCSCSPGFRQIGTSDCGVICTDIDECNTLPILCGAGRVCNNTNGGFNCPCAPGYSGANCVDINECTAGIHNCAIQTYCVNLPGSFTCRCPASGFEGDGVSTIEGGTGCLDINECDSNPCHASATCANSVGSFKCTCKAGYSGNGITCTDINECAGTNNCVTSANKGICTNTAGSYNCSCASGFSGNGIKTTSGGTGCNDVNECASADACDPIATCTNTAGAFTCACPEGYLGSGKKCYTVNCPTGQYPVNATACSACPAGTFNEQTNVEKCSPCPAGTYSVGVGKNSTTTCLSCPQNTYSEPGSSSCTSCPIGSTSSSASGTCTLCPAGQYGAQGSCKNCGAGWFSPTPGASECQPCPPGTFASANNATSCSACPPGSISKGRASSCSKCDAGKYASAGQYYCKQCAPGTSTQGNTGAASCTACSPGSFANLAGSVTCSPCAAGTYSTSNGSDICLGCAPGTYQDLAGQTGCKQCNNWKYTDVSGSTSCGSCFQGYAAEKEYGSTICYACPPGTYRTSDDQVCLPCHAGSASELAGIAHCTYCMGGFYQPKCGQTTCQVCDLGRYSLYKGSGSTKCSLCPYGQESFGTAYFCFGFIETRLV